MASIISNHNYPGLETLSDVFNLSAVASITLGNTTIVACSGQVGESNEYSPYNPSGVNGEQFSGGHTQQFEIALTNVEKALAAARPDLGPRQLWEDIFNITSFHVGELPQREQLEMAEVARRCLGKNKPAWSAIGVSFFIPPKCLVEVQVQAAYAKE